MSRVVVLGGLNMDLIAEVPHPAGPGETRFGTRFYTTPGGKGGNQAVAAARLLEEPGSVQMVARVGADRFGEELVEALARAGVGTTAVTVDPRDATGVAMIFIDANGENYVNAVYGANARCGVEELATLETLLADAAVLLLQQELPAEVTARAVELAASAGVPVILDPAPTREGHDAARAGAAILTPNEHEASDLAGGTIATPEDARRAATALRAPGLTVIVTLGALGVWIEADGISTHLAAPSVEAVATVGAGDAFNGGLAVGLAEGRALLEAARLGVATAALSVTREGAQTSMPSRGDVDALLDSGW